MWLKPLVSCLSTLTWSNINYPVVRNLPPGGWAGKYLPWAQVSIPAWAMKPNPSFRLLLWAPPAAWIQCGYGTQPDLWASWI